MRQKMLTFSAGSLIVSAAFLATHAMIGSQVRAETFDLRWAAVETVQKSDRLGTPAPATGSSVVFYSDPKAGLTVATKVEVVQNESPRKTTRDNPAENVRQDKKKKLLVGCEPSFSPVTMPSMANVTGRCLAARDGETKLAALVR